MEQNLSQQEEGAPAAATNSAPLPLPTSSCVMCPGCAQAGTTLPQLCCLQPKPLHCILLETPGTKSRHARWNKAGAELPNLDFPVGTQAWGQFVPSWVAAVWDTLQAAPALGLSAAEELSVYPLG